MKILSRISLLSVLCAGFLFAQLSTDSWNTIGAIQPGHKIRVETKDSKYTGAFAGAGAESVKIDTSKGQISIARTDVRRIYSQSGSHRLRNTLIGTGIGAAIGITVNATLGALLRNESDEETASFLLVPPIAIGAALGAILPAGTMKKVYDSSGS